MCFYCVRFGVRTAGIQMDWRGACRWTRTGRLTTSTPMSRARIWNRSSSRLWARVLRIASFYSDLNRSWRTLLTAAGLWWTGLHLQLKFIIYTHAEQFSAVIRFLVYYRVPPRSWKLMEFSKTIFQAWKLMENRDAKSNLKIVCHIQEFNFSVKYRGTTS